MAAQPIDFTSGLVPAAPTQGAGADYSAGLVSQSSPAATQPAAPKTGMQRANDALTGANETDPAWQSPYLGGMLSGALKSASGVVGNVLDMVTRKPAADDVLGQNAAADMDNPVAKYVDQHAKEAADWLRSGGQPQGFWENVGAVGEQALEFIGADGMLKMVKAPAAAAEGGGIAAQASEHLKQAQQAAQVLKANPRLAGLITIGLKAAKDSLSMDSLTTAARQGTAAGAQTYARTEGDLGAAAKAGLLTGGFGAATTAIGEGSGAVARAMRPGEAEVGKTVEGVALPPAPKTQPPTEAQAKGAQAYGKVAQGMVQPHLEDVNAASARPVKMNQPGGAPGAPAGTVMPPGVPKIDVQDTMSRVGDVTGARTALVKNMDASYNYFDSLTGGDFRKMNAQVEAADEAAATGDPKAVASYKEAVNRLDAVLDSTKGQATPEMIAAVKQGFKKYYVLGGVARTLDKSLTGLPGESAVSQEQRGINGNTLLKGLATLSQQHGGPQQLDALMGGGGKVDALRAIGEATKTNEGRKEVNAGVVNTAKFILRRTLGVTGAKIGYDAMGLPGLAAGYAAGETAAVALPRVVAKVYKAVLANPQAAQNLLFAVHSGATPENYAPLIAGIIDKHETEASRERQAQQSREGDGSQ